MSMLRRLVVLSLLVSLLPVEAARPNVLFIAVDDLNDWVGPLGGHPQVQTPNLDRLAERGTTFTNAHTQAPLCNPSRASVMLGLRPTSTGIYGLAPWFRNLEEFKDAVTIPQAFEANGYATYSAGKVHHGRFGYREGDNEFQHRGPHSEVLARPAEKLVETPFGNHPMVDWGVFPHEDEEKGDWAVASWAVETLDSRPDGPWFLAVGFFLPHVPNYAPQKWFDLYPEESVRLPPWLPGDRDDTPRASWYLHWYLPEPRLKFLRESDQWRNLTRSYLATVSFVDSQIGRVLDALERNAFGENTVVVLWSDHGYHLGEKEITGKNTLWERSTRVPLIFAGPGIRPGQRHDGPVELLDIYPTLLELCGLPANGALEGRSLAPQLEDASQTRPWPAITTHNRGNHGIRTDKWRYIVYGSGDEELYDMENDPNEWFNLASDPAHEETLSALRKWIPETERPPAPGSRNRILIFGDDGSIRWENTEIGRDDPIPGL